MPNHSNNAIDYYKQQSSITNPGECSYLFDKLPTSIIPELVKVAQGIVIDKDLIELYGEVPSEEQKNDTDSRYMEIILERILERNDNPLTVKRPPKQRFVGTCRDYAIVLCAMLRYKGIPARLRCGFDTYFNIKQDFYDDHWVCEYWNTEENRWVLVDANVDETVKQKYNITIDTLDIPRDRFVIAGQAWQMCRAGKSDPNRFGVSSIDIQGLWFVRGSVVRDLAALNKFEALPWDYWGLSDKDPEDFSEEDLRLLDRVAQLTVDNKSFKEMQTLYKETKRLKVSTLIKSYTPFGGLQLVEVSDK